MYVIETAGYSPDDIVKNGNQFTVANGLFGYRGTLEEYRAEDLVGLTMGGVHHRRRDGFEEPVAFFNPLFTYLKIAGQILHPRLVPPEKHLQGLNMEIGLHYRKTLFQIEGADVFVESERFLSSVEKSLLAFRYRFTVSKSLDIELFTGIDTKVYDCRGPHLDYPRYSSWEGIHTAMAPVLDGGGYIAVSETAELTVKCEYDAVMIDNQPLRRYRFRVTPNQPVTLYKYAAVAYGREDPAAVAVDTVVRARQKTYELLYKENGDAWKNLWKTADVLLPNSPKLQLAMRTSIFHMLGNRPATGGQSVPVRGLGCQGMQGSVSWDTELCLLPFYLNIDSLAARNLLLYRIRTLPGARAKAAAIGCKGAFFAMQSLADGAEAIVSESEAATGADRERIAAMSIFTSGVIAHALMTYFERTRDYDIMTAGGLALLIECAHFYATRIVFDPERHRSLAKTVAGPDEYHVGIDDNALINRLVAFTFETAIETWKTMKQRDPAFVRQLFEANGYTEAIDAIKAAMASLATIRIGPDFLIEQFAGYHGLEDLSIKDVKKRMERPNEYLGGPNGIATMTKLIKQADVVMLLALFEDEFSRAVKNANLQYYEPRTERGTPLSGAMHVLVAAAIGKCESVAHYFQKSLFANATFEGRQFVDNLFVGGTYPTAAGAAYLSAVYGFCGMRHKNGFMICDARLPDAITDISFKVVNFANVATVSVKPSGGKIAWEKHL